MFSTDETIVQFCKQAVSIVMVEQRCNNIVNTTL